MRNWIQSAIKKPGALTAQAKAHGMTLSEFCALDHEDPTTRRRCALYRTLMSLAKKRAKKKG